jgi:protein SCO1/2
LDLIIKNLDKKKKEKFKVFFVSIDPERDSPEIIKDYLNSFENKIYGITGDPKKIFIMSKSWGILSEKIFTEDGNYLINHSSSIILLNNGKYLDRISHHAVYEDILKTINKYLR